MLCCVAPRLAVAERMAQAPVVGEGRSMEIEVTGERAATRRRFESRRRASPCGPRRNSMAIRGAPRRPSCPRARALALVGAGWVKARSRLDEHLCDPRARAMAIGGVAGLLGRRLDRDRMRRRAGRMPPEARLSGRPGAPVDGQIRLCARVLAGCGAMSRGADLDEVVPCPTEWDCVRRAGGGTIHGADALTWRASWRPWGVVGRLLLRGAGVGKSY